MVRVDAWQRTNDTPSLDLGYPRGFEDAFLLLEEVGKGGFGKVHEVEKRASGKRLACKVLRKRLVGSNETPLQERHLKTTESEVTVLKELRYTLNVVHLDSVYEDDENVYVVMELCTGGELWHRIGLRPYSEETVARIMRAVLRTLAQCHAHKILHRDVKPGNFMWLSTSDDSPIKAVDFGLAVFFDPKSLPRDDLGYDGTPWFMAPEVLSSAVVPASDLWAAGVMAHQLLTGYLPFDDRKNRKEPALSLVWKSILTDAVDFERSYWAGISKDAKDFVRMLLVKDPACRPSAVEALKHAWVRKGGSNIGTPTLSLSIVQRIQRYGQSTIFRRSVLEMIAKELLQLEMETSRRGREVVGIPCTHPFSRDLPCRSWHGGSLMSQAISAPGSYSILRNSPDLANLLSTSGSRPSLLGNFMGGEQRCRSHQDLTQLAEHNYEEWHEKRKAVRVSLDTSINRLHHHSKMNKEDFISSRLDNNPNENESDEDTTDYEAGRRGQNLYHNFVRAKADQKKDPVLGDGLPSQAPKNVQPKSLLRTIRAQPFPMLSKQADECTTQKKRTLSGSHTQKPSLLRSLSKAGELADTERFLDVMKLTDSKTSNEVELMQGLQSLGYRVNESELPLLLDCIAPAHDGQIHLSQFLASQLDWQHVQKNHREEWLECVRHAFTSMDKDGDGKISSTDLIQAIGEKLPAAEVDRSVEQAKLEACIEEMDFDGFVRMIEVDSWDSGASLDQFDSRSAMPHYSIGLTSVNED